ncbi:MAG TPA: TIGR03752 family integrating conjugative element protein [Gammaproteobacteria bacterium]|nr:TIGR03752 family integrating conjugative element protein [Gammaproteobacteria bacterium]
MNKMLPVLLLVVLASAGAVLTLVFRSPDTPETAGTGLVQRPDETPALPATDTEVAEVTNETADRDDYVETVQTLSAQLDEVAERNDQLASAVDILSNSLDKTLDERIAAQIDAARDNLINSVEQTLEGNLKDWRQQLAQLKAASPHADTPPAETAAGKHPEAGSRAGGAPAAEHAGIPPGFGYDYPVNTPDDTAPINTLTIGGRRYVRLTPLSAAPSVSAGKAGELLAPLSGLSSPSAPGAGKQTTDTAHQAGVKPSKSDIIKRYTIPDTSTLVGSTSLTALLGRVPFQGKVVSPFRFKIITGGDNLATNGHRIPGIRNIVWSGYAHGVREQECVRGFLDTVTYTFEDGTISTYSVKRKQQNSNTTTTQQYIAYISDPWGKPCIRGTLYSNASDYLRDRIIVATAAAASRSAASSRTTTTQSASNNSISSFVSGDKTQFIAADAFAGGLDEATEYLRDIMNDAFDVVYVQTGQPVTINVEREIPIDYNPDGRKLAHERTIHTPTPSRLD